MYLVTNGRVIAKKYLSNFHKCNYTYDKQRAFKFKTLSAAAQFAVVNNMFIESVRE